MLIDSHTHVNFAAYDSDREEVIKRALDAGVWMVNVGTQQDTSRKAVELAQNYEKGVYAAVGLHPTEEERFDYEYYKKLASDPKVVAIGECGLDYYRIRNDESGITERQRSVFEEHIRLAAELKKPLMIHCRPSAGTDDAYRDVLSVLSHAKAQGIAHFYAGSLEVTKKFVNAGFYFTFGGVITFSRDYDEVIKYIPLNRILTETDAPYVTPEPYRSLSANRRSKRNEPAYVIETAKKLAEIRRIDFDKIAEQTKRNAIEVFGLLS